jgi:lipoprotein-anchoring transpeptidase ErfK/SrfK
LITKSQYDQIKRAMQNRTAPPQTTRLGGQIYIHGNGSRTDWTLGCIALENEEMKELFDAVPVGINVTVEP